LLILVVDCGKVARVVFDESRSTDAPRQRTQNVAPIVNIEKPYAISADLASLLSFSEDDCTNIKGLPPVVQAAPDS
jgi:hypothetical protein